MRHRVMTSWTRLRPWFTPSEEAVRRWVVMQSLVTIVTLPLVLWQVYDLSEQRTGREISALMALDQRLDLEGSRAIRHRLYARKPMPLLRPDGPATPESLGDFLDTFESLAALWQRNLVDIESVDEWFGDLIERAAAHPEIRAYIREQQREDPDFYTAFQDMAEKIAKLNPVSRSSRPTFRAPLSRP
jgi:hypothetical protein